MVNPFDRNFFHFLAGFILILCLGFSVLYFAGKYRDDLDQKNAAAALDSTTNRVIR